VQLGHAADALRLVAVVELLAEAVRQLAPDRLEVGVGQQGEQRPQQQLEVAEVGGDDAVDQRVLQLDRHRPAVAQGGPVHLPDRGGGERLWLDRAEQLAVVRQLERQLLLHHLEGDRRHLLLQRAQHRRHLGGQDGVVQRQHLPHLHRRALQLAQGGDDPRGVAHQVLAARLLAAVGGARQPGELLPGHRGADARDQPAEAEQAAGRRAGRLAVGHRPFPTVLSFILQPYVHGRVIVQKRPQ